MNPPTLSVILPVYNGARYVAASIQSVLAQTFTDFELIVINDGSTDSTQAIIEAFDDPRIQIVRQKNQGLAATLNVGIAMSRGRFLARQDHDDLSLPTRFAEQLNFFDTHPDHALLGTRATIWRGDLPTSRSHDHPLDNETLQFGLLFDNYFVHSSVMMRKEAVLDVGGYADPKIKYFPEDFDLWSRMAQKYKVANLKGRLVSYREVPESISRQGSFRDNLIGLCARNLAFATRRAETDPLIHRLAALWHRQGNPLVAILQYRKWIIILTEAARNLGIQAGTQGYAIVQVFEQRLRRRILLSCFDALPSWSKLFIHQLRDKADQGVMK